MGDLFRLPACLHPRLSPLPYPTLDSFVKLIQQDGRLWRRVIKKPNLRYLYLMLFPTCMGIEMTSVWDSQMINAVQFVDLWQECKSTYVSKQRVRR